MFDEKYNEYINLLNTVFTKNQEKKIINHSKAVAKLVSNLCSEYAIHDDVKMRAVKLALIHDIGKIKWLEENMKDNRISDYEAGKVVLESIENPSENIKYIFYLLKYLDYEFINSASIMSFPIEVLLVCYADLQIIEEQKVTITKRKEYVFNTYFKGTKREKEFSDFWNGREKFHGKFESYLSTREKIWDKNYYTNLAFNTGGWLYGKEYSFLQELSNIASKTEKDFVEVGSWRGKSTILITSSLKELASNRVLYCVDDWKGGTDDDCLRLANHVNIFYEFQNNTHNLSNYIKPVKGLSTDKITVEKLPKEIGFIFLDGAHDYDTVKKEILIYKNKIVKGGIICFHDTDNPNYPGVRKAIEKFLLNGDFKFIGQESYIAAYKKI